jgi:hypothetical protein
MGSNKKSTLIVALLLLPLQLSLADTSFAQATPEPERRRQSDHKSNNPDLVFTEDTQLALSGKVGKAVIGSCEEDQPLWKGKIAIKNIGRATVYAEPPPESRLVPTRELDWPHVRAYVPNNIELQAEARLKDDLGEFGQELIELSIGEDEPKCRNYDAPPVFDEHLSGHPGPLYQTPAPPPPPTGDPLSIQIKRIQTALIEKGYPLPAADGDYGPNTIRALKALFKERNQPPPPGINQRPPSPQTVALLLDALGIGKEPPPGPVPAPIATGSTKTGRDECIRGINLVPIYLEIDPERQIPDEDRSNNRVQFTVAIDCSHVAK